MPVLVGERLRTTAVGSLGLTLADDRLITAGPHSPWLINDFQFDTTTHEGNLLTTLAKRTLSVVTGCDAIFASTSTAILKKA